ncbi:MAG TPA: GAF domain-containing sensor histidine kinase [Candidatus Limnocylindria bacterium]|nr:GAF domain-containing sensor histidine kinase [Candidatus Limnocylindria bacterium]
MAAVNASTQLESLLRLQQDLALETDIARVLARIVQTATETLDAERATLYVIDHGRHELWSRVLTEGTELGATEVREIRLSLDGQSLAAEVARSGAVLRIDAPYDDPRFDPSTDQRTGFRTRSILVAPIDARDRRRLGVLQVVNKRDGAFTPSDEEFVQALAASAGVSLEYVELSAELAAERLRVVKVAEEERHRLARDLHDGVAQVLANAAIGIEIATKRAATDVPAALAELDTLRTRLLDSQHSLRDILFALRPLPLEDGGLPAAVRALAERVDGTNGSVVTARRMESTRRLKREVEAGAFTVIRESANNAIKTGRAPHVHIDVYDEADAVVAVVEDDGSGFDVAEVLRSYASRGSLGLLQMRESARLIGAQLSIDSSPGNGTRIRLRIPT